MDNSKLTKVNIYNLRYLTELNIQYHENFGTDRGDRIFKQIEDFGTVGLLYRVILRERETGLTFSMTLINVTKEAILQVYNNNWRGFRERFYTPEILNMETGKLLLDK